MNRHNDPLDDHHCVTIESSEPSKSLPVDVSGGGGFNYIQHSVSKFDTLAGVAIKYGVEVGDIKRLNGLVTDHQMFALKTLQIPLHGRHPPSATTTSSADASENQGQGPNISERSRRRHSDFFDSFQSLKLKSSPLRKASSATSRSRVGYYGVEPEEHKDPSSGACFEMAVYQKGGDDYLMDGSFAKYALPPPPHLNPPLTHTRKCKSMADGFLSKNCDSDAANQEHRDYNNDGDGWLDMLMLWRRPNSEVNIESSTTPEMLMKEDNSSSGGAFSTALPGGKGLALRPKAASRTVSGAAAADSAEAGRLNAVPTSMMDSVVANSFSGVRKSTSTPSFQGSDNNTSSSSSSSLSIWSSSKWSLKQDLQALSTAAITIPIFDSLSTGRKSKAAID